MNKLSKLTETYCNKAILITNPKDIYYLTGADFDGFWLLLYNKKIFAITSNMVKGQVLKHFNKRLEIVVANLFSDGIIEICKKNNTLVVFLVKCSWLIFPLWKRLSGIVREMFVTRFFAYSALF